MVKNVIVTKIKVFLVLAAVMHYFRLSVAVAITWRHFSRALHGRKPRFAIKISMMCLPKFGYMYFRSRPSFVVVGHYWYRLEILFSSLPLSKTAVGILTIFCHTFGDIGTSCIGIHIAISGFLVTFASTVVEIDMVDYLRFVVENKQI